MLGRVSLELRSGKTSGLTAARGRSRMTPYGADRHTPDDDSDDNDPPKTGSWPAQWRFAYSNRTDEALMPTYGYNLIDVTSKDEADAVPPGTQRAGVAVRLRQQDLQLGEERHLHQGHRLL